MNELNVIEQIEKKTYFTILYNFYYKIGNYFYKTVLCFVKIGGIYVVWILLHYFSSQLYSKLCTPNNLFGFIMSPFLRGKTLIMPIITDYYGNYLRGFERKITANNVSPL
jgi:hypothetical protein